ncbi:MAG: hypothetical protein P1V19_14470 [Gimesia sp.]|nr:hypothetical protein [Gimesia sp.]
MTDEEDLWDGSEYAQNASMQNRQALEALERIDVGSYGRVLDIGCGNGAVTKVLSGRDLKGLLSFNSALTFSTGQS